MNYKYLNVRMSILLKNNKEYTIIVKNCMIIPNVPVCMISKDNPIVISCGPVVSSQYSFIILFPENLNLEREIRLFLDETKNSIVDGYQINVTDKLVTEVAKSCLYAWRQNYREKIINIISDDSTPEKLGIKFKFNSYFTMNES